jgi:hypothetical protein
MFAIVKTYSDGIYGKVIKNFQCSVSAKKYMDELLKGKLTDAYVIVVVIDRKIKKGKALRNYVNESIYKRGWFHPTRNPHPKQASLFFRYGTFNS